jgi:hypothetical protein
VTAAADYDLVADLIGERGEVDAPPGSRKPPKTRRLRTLA